MILLVTPSERASECAAALHEATGEPVRIAENLAQAVIRMRAECFLVVVFDQYLLESEADAAVRTAIEHLGAALPLQVNFAICGMDRLVREVRAGTQRREREKSGARQAALAELHSEMGGTITALSLSVELALTTPNLPRAAFEKLESVHQLVKQLRNRLESGEAGDERKKAAVV